MAEDEILNSQDPMQMISWCIRKANKDLMALAFKWPKTDDDKAKMVELKQKIKDLAVSVINYSFSSFPILSKCWFRTFVNHMVNTLLLQLEM